VGNVPKVGKTATLYSALIFLVNIVSVIHFSVSYAPSVKTAGMLTSMHPVFAGIIVSSAEVSC